MSLLGRTEELRRVADAIAARGARVVVVSGRRGIGKTTLATEVAAHFRDRSSYFDRTPAMIAGHGKSADVLVDDVYRAVTDAASRAQRPKSIPELVAQALQQDVERRTLVFIDNVEEEAQRADVFQSLLDRWVSAGSKDVLLLTIRDWATLDARWETEGVLVNVRLGGLKEPEAILDLVGPSLQYRFDDASLLEAAAELGNVPQHLLSLRWADPPDLGDFVSRYRAEPESATIDSLRQVLKPMPGGEWFVALGLLRRIDLSHEVLRGLWRKLSSNSPVVDALLDAALEEKLLLPGSGSSSAYRLHPDVHLDLRRLSEERGRAWMRFVHERALEVFSDLLAADPDDLSSCSELVHHALLLDKPRRAIDAACDGIALERWRMLGLSVRVEAAVAELRAAIDEFPQLWHGADGARVYLASAEIASDLGRPSVCLDYLERAASCLEFVDESDYDPRPMRRRIWRQMAISHANLGETEACISNYGRVIASDRDVDDPATALCMGYLGYEYCDKLDFERAREWTELALRSCSRARSPSVFAKNLSNRALVHIYEGRTDEARTLLEDALELVAQPGSPAADVREHGRALLNLGTVYLAQPDVPLLKAQEKLAAAMALTKKAGDARRAATATGRLGVMAAFYEDFGRAVTMLHEAMQVHRDLGDRRNMMLELLDLLAVRALRMGRPQPVAGDELLTDVSELLAGASHAACRGAVEEALRELDVARTSRYTRFWERCHAHNVFRRANAAPSAA